MFWILQLPIYLRQRFFTGHGQDRVAEGDENTDESEQHPALWVQAVFRLLILHGVPAGNHHPGLTGLLGPAAQDLGR